MFFTTHDQQKIYYESKGNEQSPHKILFLNGLTQTTIAWNMTIQPLLKDYHIYLLDLVFQGQSSAPKEYLSFNNHALNVFGFINTVVRQKIILVGISYGSLVSQHLAVNYPHVLDKLILISTFGHKTPLYKSIELSWKNALKTGGYELLLDVMLPFVLGNSYFDNPFIPIETLKGMRKELQPHPDSILKLMQATEERDNYLKEMASITCPTLIIQGRNDLLFPVFFAQAVQQAISGSKLEIVEHCGHTINLEAPEKLSNLIRNFINN